MKDMAVDSETVCLWVDDRSYDRAIKTACMLSIAKLRLKLLYEYIVCFGLF